MKKTFSLFILFVLFSVSGFSQLSLKLKYPKCELVNKAVLLESKDNKTIMITSQEEFEKLFKITDDSKINFEKNVVLAVILGTYNKDKYIYIDAASFIPESRKLLVKWDYKNDYFKEVNAANSTGEYCVAVIQKMNFKNTIFLKGKAYSIRYNYRD